MQEVTAILDAVARGDAGATDVLFPLVYDELRRLAARRMAQERAGQTLDATGLVHEAYLRLVGEKTPQNWNGRGHFFGAAAEAMRRILVERARRKGRLKHGGQRERVELREELLASRGDDDEILAVDEALEALAQDEPQVAELVKLHFFAGLPLEEAASLLGIPARTAYRNWAYARAWLYRRLDGEGSAPHKIPPGGGNHEQRD